MATHGPTLLICVCGEDSEEWLGTSRHSLYSVVIGPSDYHLFGFVKGNIRGHIIQPMRHSKKLSIFICKLLRWSSATTVWFSDSNIMAKIRLLGQDFVEKWSSAETWLMCCFPIDTFTWLWSLFVHDVWYGPDFFWMHNILSNPVITVSLCDTFSIASDILWYQLIPHRSP